MFEVWNTASGLCPRHLLSCLPCCPALFSPGFRLLCLLLFFAFPASFPDFSAPLTGMALSSSPRKVIPLAMEDEHVPRPKPRSAGSNLTRRVFFCGVVVEGTEGGRELSQGAFF